MYTNEDRTIPPLVNANQQEEAFDTYVSDKPEAVCFSYFGISKPQTRSSAIQIIIGDGRRYIVYYSKFTGAICFDGKNEIEFKTIGAQFKIVGHNLLPIVHALADQTLVWIKEPENSAGEDVQDGEPIITEIIPKPSAK